MPIHIDSVINEISPETNASSDSEQTDKRWQKRQEVNSLRDLEKYLQQRVSADEFDD